MATPAKQRMSVMGTTNLEGEILTLDEVAAFLKAGKRTVYRFAQSGEIPAFKLGGTWRFRRSELERWIDQNSNQRAPAKPAPVKKGRR